LSEELYFTLLYIWIALAIFMFPVLLRFTAPYGRHSSDKWGPMINNRLAWILMELPVIIVFTLFFFLGNGLKSAPLYLMYSLFILHYINRIFIFPLQLKGKNKKMPLAVALMAIFFNLINGFMNGYWFGYLAPKYEISWLYSWPFIAGILLFFGGMYINIHADQLLIALRERKENTYYIPKGWLFQYVSSPNLLGEIIEWTGWALLCWCMPAFSFALWTLANLLPRALDHHRWYHQYFQDYPKERKAIFPFVL
jgi:3-oxo-5-alpha-steroid 4-dehydrogenase 1